MSFSDWFKNFNVFSDKRYQYPETHFVIPGSHPGLFLNISLYSPYYDRVNFVKMIGFFGYLDNLSKEKPDQYAKTPWATYTIKFLGVNWEGSEQFMKDHPIVSIMKRYHFMPGKQPSETVLSCYDVVDHAKIRLAMKRAQTNGKPYSSFERMFPLNAYAGLQLKLDHQKLSCNFLNIYGDCVADYIQLIDSGILKIDYNPSNNLYNHK